jgi:hypothetical protein
MAASTGKSDPVGTAETTGTTDAEALAKLSDRQRLGELSDEEFAESKRRMRGLQRPQEQSQSATIPIGHREVRLLHPASLRLTPMGGPLL